MLTGVGLVCLVSAGLVAYVDLDERAIDALREFNEEGALTVLQQFKESDLSHVQVCMWTDHIPIVFIGIIFSILQCCHKRSLNFYFNIEQKCFPLWSHEDLQTERKAGE